MIVFKKVYRVSYDLLVQGAVEDNGEPTETQFVVAENFEEAFQFAKTLIPELRKTAVHRDLLIREVELELFDVVVGIKESDR